MILLKRFRARPRKNHITESAEMERMLERGPHDRPAGIRNNHALLRSYGGW